MRQARRLLLVDKPDKKDLMTLLPEDFEKPDQGGSEEKTNYWFPHLELNKAHKGPHTYRFMQMNCAYICNLHGISPSAVVYFFNEVAENFGPYTI